MKAYWHIHHNQLLEFSDNIRERIEYIKRHKPAYETDLRLALLKPVRGKLPRAVVEAEKACQKARIAKAEAYVAWITYCKAQKFCKKARVIYKVRREAFKKAVMTYKKMWSARCKVIEIYRAEIEALHKKECPNCPWNGKTIFPREEEEDAVV